jgi:hypothetical protein
MRPRGLLILITLVPFLWLATPAQAATGCDAPPGTAAADQYCETLPAADGMTDATGEGLLPLAAVLPKALVRRLERAGLLGQVLLALPAVVGNSSDSRARRAAREASTDPRLGSLLPDGPETSRSAAQAVLDRAGMVDPGFTWTLVLSLLALAGVSGLGFLRGWSLR